MTTPVHGVYLSDMLDLDALYGDALAALGPDVVLHRPEDVRDPDAIRFAICWLPGAGAFARFPGIELAMSIGAGVDALLTHPGVGPDTQIARVRDPYQASLMAGFAVHEVLHVRRGFDAMARNAARAEWRPPALTSPDATTIAVLGDGTMGRAVSVALRQLGFDVRIACRSVPQTPAAGCRYFTGPEAVAQAAEGAHVLINVLPLTAATENVLDAALFARLARGAWLVQIGRGEHLVEADLTAALAAGYLAGASLDVFRTEPLPADHPFWRDDRLRITPHVASDSIPEVVARQVVETARELAEGRPLTLGIDRARGY
ncbi:NAD(P)-dependent oxidoreductase [Falsirhodobacter halotolerans]|uniref:NAD(P)-dependent oxidoreductase n=1 Tax=Falsirhodobacter halotolerans TaxID=1146892 RepID=UPI001FCFF343|nr:NAD(P)-dependent oxidoreductase [Falsirhodobacter halotolerans]MCJ8139167.1 NAD(P)-binding domain-containing protein [Falsirhodobacter halotolerans]